MFCAALPHAAGPGKLPYNGIVPAPAGLGQPDGAARESGAASMAATVASPTNTRRVVFENPCMLPSSAAASHSPRINVFRNGLPRAQARCGGWDFPLRAVRARLLKPWTPARPDPKSGAVVLAWLPPPR